MSVEDHTVSFSLEINVEPAAVELRRILTFYYRYLDLLRKLGLPEEASEQIRKLQEIMAAVNSLRLAYGALQAARMAAGDPIAWGMAAMQAGIAIDSLYDLTRGV
jgi:precorrin-3B methylase